MCTSRQSLISPSSVLSFSIGPSVGRYWPIPRAVSYAPSYAMPDALPDYRVYEVVVDAADPFSIASWWAERYAADVCQDQDQGFSWIDRVEGMPWPMVFQLVPESKTVKNRMHWDVWGDTETFLAAGARLLRSRDDEIGWDVLADPEGNEFCVFTRPDI